MKQRWKKSNQCLHEHFQPIHPTTNPKPTRESVTDTCFCVCVHVCIHHRVPISMHIGIVCAMCVCVCGTKTYWRRRGTNETSEKGRNHKQTHKVKSVQQQSAIVGTCARKKTSLARTTILQYTPTHTHTHTQTLCFLRMEKESVYVCECVYIYTNGGRWMILACQPTPTPLLYTDPTNVPLRATKVLHAWRREWLIDWL